MEQRARGPRRLLGNGHWHWDSGQKQSLIFQPFAQADSSMVRRYGGAGLGLSISMHLGELMGGRMWVTSEPAEGGGPAKGGTFHFSVRFARPLAQVQGASNERVGGVSSTAPSPSPG